MVPSSSSWDISWSLPITRRKCCSSYESKDRSCVSTISFGICDNFETVQHLRAGPVPENWADLVTNSKEKSTEVFYDITKTWFDGEVDITADSPDTSIPSAAMHHTSVAMQQPAAAMQQPAAKQQPLAAMQQPATKQQPQSVMQQSYAMQTISSAESPIFKRNSSAESPNLEDTTNNDNGGIDFNENSSMPSIINLETTVLL